MPRSPGSPPPRPPDLTRRALLSLPLVGAWRAMASDPAAAAFVRQPARRWGAQLYTVRDLIARDAARTLEAVAGMGYVEVKAIQPTLLTVGPIAERLGLAIVGVHLDGPTSAGEGLTSLIEDAKQFGVRYLVVPWIPVEERAGGRAAYERVGARLNRIGEQVATAGMQLAYHNHAFEFAQIDDTARGLDVLLQSADAALVKLELDVFWVSISGANPLDLIRQYSGRIELMHLKDMAPGAGPTLREDQVPHDAFADVGSGAIDFPAILAAADEAGVRHVFVEHDHPAGDSLDSLKQSIAYLKTL